jgi:hypothetical protein
MKEIKFNKNNLFTDCNDIDASAVSTAGVYELTFDPPSGVYTVTPVSSASIGAAVTPIVRTNNPTIGANTVNANISALDAAIGVTPTSTNVIAAANSVNTNLSLVDAAIHNLQNTTSATIAAAGTNQTNGTPITTSIAVVSAANATKCVVLPSASSSKSITIYNITAAENLVIFPAVGEVLNGKAANASCTLVLAGGVSECICTYAGAGAWTITAVVGTVS